MVKRKSRITERNTEPQKDNTLIATTPPPDSRVPGVIANHNAMVQWNLEHPNDKVYRIEDLIQKEKEANPSWVKRAANLAVNPVPTSNSGMMAVPNPNSPVRSTVKDELGVAMAAASTPMIGAELGIYGPVYGGLRLAAGSAAATGAYHVAGKAGDWIDEKAGTNWAGDLNRTVAPFVAFPLGAKYAYRGAVPLVGLASRYGTVPDWIATPKVKTDAIKWGLKQRYKADIATPKIETEPTLQIGPEARPQLTGHFGKVKYYGPTMGKTTAARSNRGFIDFDDIIRNPSRAILDRFGFKTKADLYNSGNQEAIKAYEDMLLHEMQAFRANPENQGKRLLVSPSAVANPEVTGFDFDNVPVIPSRDVFIERNVARGGTPEESAEWYDALLARNPNLQIDDRFVSDIERPFYVAPQASLRNITLDELRGVPKGERNARKPQPRVVNRDGSINWVNLQKAYDNLINKRGKWLKHDLFEEGLNNAPGEASTLWGHTTGVVRTAQQIPVPKGSSRAELVRAALIHDLGKLETGQERIEHPNHPYISEDMIDDLEFPEFDTPTIRSAVRSHMNDTGMDQFMKSGIEKEEIMPGFYEITNFDLLKALQAADVARGLSYDAAAARFPQLFRYQKQAPFKVNWFSGTPEEEITRVVNPILKREGYPVISLKDPIIPQLTDRRKRHRSFFRAIDIDGEPVDYQGVFNRQELERQALKNFGSDSDMFKRIAAATMTSREPTGGLKAFAIDVDHDGYWDGYGRRAEHGSTRFSRRIKFSPYKTDALFLSTSPSIVRQYSGKEPGSAIVGYLPMYPMQEGESPVQFMERTEFPMMDSDAILSDNTPMSLWQKYGWPYRMQTGRSLLSDLRDAYTGRLRELNKIGEWYDDPTIVENINKMVQELSDLGFNFKPPMDEKKGVFLVTSKRPYYNLFSENNLDRKTNILLHLGLITPKQARWRSFIPRRPNSWLFGLDPNNEMETFKKYVWNKNTIRKIVNKLFEKTPRHMVVSKEYKDYLKDEEAIIKFLRDRGIRPLWELPHFYQPIVFKGHGSFGSKPVTRGKEFTEGDGQGFVLAPKDSKVLEYREDVDPSLLPYSYYGRWTDENLYPVSRKTFKKGGIIKGQDEIDLRNETDMANLARKE